LVLAKTLVALVAATTLVPLASPAASAQVAPSCNTESYLISFANSTYVSSELGYGGDLYGMLRARASSPGPWENYRVCGRYEGSNKVNFISNEQNGRYVTAELGRTGVDYGMLRARATAVGPWEKFTITRWGPNPSMYTIRSQANGRYVSAELGYGGVRHGMLRARATSIGNWEKFFILCGVPATCRF
jgi:hypothetical protein